ncbi:MAG TPA: glucuronate isomerase, partial [Calditrichia bacterium]|nr:glucuronate isomerase [Calditrichia bacterium]
MQSNSLNPDRFFDPDSTVRAIARDLYEGIKDLPIVSPHGHCEPSWFSQNAHFPDPTALILIPDHYIFRMLYSQGIPMESLGIPTRDGTAVEGDLRKIWQIFADHFYLFAGTPTGQWLAHEFRTVFGVEEKFSGDSAQRIYDHIAAQLASEEFRPRAMFERFNIEALSTTDPAESNLAHHRQMREDGWKGNIVPCFRPDGVTDLSRADWRQNLDALGKVTNLYITDYGDYIRALEEQRAFFKNMGATATDHGVESPYTEALPTAAAEKIFARALAGKASAEDARLFTAHMLMEMARMSCDDGLVMQIHPGSWRNHSL